MKILLTVIASMMITGTAMAACSKSSPQECTTEADCKGLEKDGSSKYTFNASAKEVKCMLDVPSVATKCTESNDSQRAEQKAKESAKPESAPGSSDTRSR